MSRVWRVCPFVAYVVVVVSACGDAVTDPPDGGEASESLQPAPIRIYGPRGIRRLSGLAARYAAIAAVDSALADTDRIRRLYREVGLDADARIAHLISYREMVTGSGLRPMTSDGSDAATAEGADPPYPFAVLAMANASDAEFSTNSNRLLQWYPECFYDWNGIEMISTLSFFPESWRHTILGSISIDGEQVVDDIRTDEITGIQESPYPS